MSNVGLFISHMGLGDILLLLPAIKHYAKIVDLLYVCCKDIYIDSIKQFLIDYTNIEIISIDSKFTAKECNNALHEIINTLKNKYTNVNLYLSGDYSQNVNTFIDFPVHFYKDLNLDFKEIFTNYDVITTDNAIILFNYTKNINKPYIFMHTSASNLEVELDIDIANTDVLIINPEKNVYDINHIHYDIANKFIRKDNNYTLIDYKLLIENANELHLIDSCYFCLAMLCKNIQSKNNIVYARYEQPFKTLLNNTWTQYYYNTDTV